MNTQTSTVSKRQPNRFRDYETLNKKLYKELNPAVDYSTWKIIIQESNKQIGEFVLTNPLGFELPNRLGLLIITKSKRNSGEMYYDKKHFCKTGIKKRQLNLHSLGFSYKICWKPQKSTIFSLRKIYKFSAVRTLNRKLASLIFSDKDIFFESTSKYDFTSLC